MLAVTLPRLGGGYRRRFPHPPYFAVAAFHHHAMEPVVEASTTGGLFDVGELGWYSENSHADRQRVGQKRPNAFGLYDLHGNAIEWCRDIYSEDFYSSTEGAGPDPVFDPPADSGEVVDLTRQRVLRGGGYDGRSVYCRSADRYREYPGKTDVHGTFGFRTVRSVIVPSQPQGRANR